MHNGRSLQNHMELSLLGTTSATLSSAHDLLQNPPYTVDMCLTFFAYYNWKTKPFQ